MVDTRYKESFTLTVDGEDYVVEVKEIPFREGVELQVEIEGELLRVSDRGLGIHEASRILQDEIRKFLKVI